MSSRAGIPFAPTAATYYAYQVSPRRRGQYPRRWASLSDINGTNATEAEIDWVSIPSQVGIPFGPNTFAHDWWSLRASQYPRRWASLSDFQLENLIHEPISVSIPSQVGIPFGPFGTMPIGMDSLSLNTLAGGHPFRTDQDLNRMTRKDWVSIPSQVGIPFGRQFDPHPQCSSQHLISWPKAIYFRDVADPSENQAKKHRFRPARPAFWKPATSKRLTKSLKSFQNLRLRRRIKVRAVRFGGRGRTFYQYSTGAGPAAKAVDFFKTPYCPDEKARAPSSRACCVDTISGARIPSSRPVVHGTLGFNTLAGGRSFQTFHCSRHHRKYGNVSIPSQVGGLSD